MSRVAHIAGMSGERSQVDGRAEQRYRDQLRVIGVDKRRIQRIFSGRPPNLRSAGNIGPGAACGAEKKEAQSLIGGADAECECVSKYYAAMKMVELCASGAEIFDWLCMEGVQKACCGSGGVLDGDDDGSP